MKTEEIINKLIERETKELEKQQKVCVKRAYNFENGTWNEEHFKYCEADVIQMKIVILEELKLELKKEEENEN